MLTALVVLVTCQHSHLHSSLSPDGVLSSILLISTQLTVFPLCFGCEWWLLGKYACWVVNGACTGKYVHEAHLEGKLDGGIVLMGFDDNISKCLQGWMGMNKICFQPLVC